MSAQFQLNWDNTAALANANAIGQRAIYRQKAVGGSFISTGFTPANDLPTSANTTNSPVLFTNKIYEFKVQVICTAGGPTDNENGIQEALKFECLDMSNMNSLSGVGTVTITVDCSGTDITKGRFKLIKNLDDSVIDGPDIIDRVGTTLTYTASGLIDEFTYHFELELYATVNGVEIISSDAGQLNANCIGPDYTPSS